VGGGLVCFSDKVGKNREKRVLVTLGPRTSSNDVRHVSISKPMSSYHGAYSFVFDSINCATVICSPNMLLFILWRDTTSELWTLVHSFYIAITILLLLALFTFLPTDAMSFRII
jgi:hypothetical protein